MTGKHDALWSRTVEVAGAVAGLGTILASYLYLIVFPYAKSYYQTFAVSLDQAGVTPTTVMVRGDAPTRLLTYVLPFFIGLLVPWPSKWTDSISSWTRRASVRNRAVAILSLVVCAIAIAFIGRTTVPALSSHLADFAGLFLVEMILLSVGVIFRALLTPDGRRTVVLAALVLAILGAAALRPTAIRAGSEDAFRLIQVPANQSMRSTVWQRMAGIPVWWTAKRIDSAGLEGVSSHYDGHWVRMLGGANGRGVYFDLSTCRILSIPDSEIAWTNSPADPSVLPSCANLNRGPTYYDPVDGA